MSQPTKLTHEDSGYVPSNESSCTPPTSVSSKKLKKKSVFKNAHKKTTNKKKRHRREYNNGNDTNLKSPKRRKLNNNNVVHIDLSGQTSDDDDDAENDNCNGYDSESMKIALNKSLESNSDNDSDDDIDIEDKEIALIGISIGTHSHYWYENNNDNQPKLIFNKHKNGFNLLLNSTSNDYVNISIKSKNVKRLIMASNNPQYFDINSLKIQNSLIKKYKNINNNTSSNQISQYFNVIFLQTNHSLSLYKWLLPHYNPLITDDDSDNKKYIMFIIDSSSLQRFRHFVLNKSYQHNLYNLIVNIDENQKIELIKLFKLSRKITKEWKKMDKKYTESNLQVYINNEDQENNPDNDNNNNSVDVHHGQESECESSGSDLSELLAPDDDDDIDDDNNDNNNNNNLNGNYLFYLANNSFISNPHHLNSLEYIKYRRDRPENDLQCYWIFPSQHNHPSVIISIFLNDINRLRNKEYLNDTIIDFMAKYIYSSWPSSFKEDVYIFSSFFWRKLQKLGKKKNILQNEKEVLKFTKNYSDIFNKKYIIIPKCHKNHWELIIICYPSYALLNQNDNNKQSQSQTSYILMLDSLNNRKSKATTSKLFRKWLNLQARNSNKNIRNNIFTTKTCKGYVINVPTQPNDLDCGCFLLRNILQFGIDGGFKFNDKISTKSLNKGNWYDPKKDGITYRLVILNTIQTLINEQKFYHQKLLQHWKEKDRAKIKLKKLQKKKKNK